MKMQIRFILRKRIDYMQIFKIKKKITIAIKDSRSCFEKTIINNSYCRYLTQLN